MSGEKTEQPTDKHLRDAAEEGQVAKSQEVSATAVVLAVFVYVWAGYDWMAGEIKDLMILASDSIGHPFGAGLKNLVGAGGWTFLILTVPCVLLAAVAGALGHLVQTGIMFAWKAATPRLDNLNPKNWFSKTFSWKNLIEFLRSIIKIGAVTWIFYYIFMDALPLVLGIPGHGLNAVDVMLREVMGETVQYCIAAFVVIAALDWLFQRYLFLKQHMMSKEDIKNENKEAEGDPQVKSQRKQMYQEISANDKTESVRNADVLVTNPTHLAIAIEYKRDKTPLPIILAKGEGALAARMIKIAGEAGIPVMRNVPLAHDLWEKGRELEYIPSELIEPVAEVLVWLRDLREREKLP